MRNLDKNFTQAPLIKTSFLPIFVKTNKPGESLKCPMSDCWDTSISQILSIMTLDFILKQTSSIDYSVFTLLTEQVYLSKMISINKH